MILILFAALVILSVPLMGGRLGRLADIQLKWLWAAPIALAIQVVIMAIAPGGNESLHAAIHIATYVLAGLFLWANRGLPGVPVIGAGTLLNAIPIVSNGGVMPQWATAERIAGLPVHTGFQNSVVLAHPHLLALGDIIPVPAPFGLHNVLSVGDVLIFAGMVLMLHRICGASLPGRKVSGSVDYRPGIADTDAMLGLALTSFQAVQALWQAGAKAHSPLARRTLATFEMHAATVTAMAHGNEALMRASEALAQLSAGLAAWADGEPLDQPRERTLMRSERLLAAARSSYLLGEHPVAKRRTERVAPSAAGRRSRRRRSRRTDVREPARAVPQLVATPE